MTNTEHDDFPPVSREGSRLEVDDPHYCKKCGKKIEAGVKGGNGEIVVWSGEESDWIELERCVLCAAEKRLREVENLYEGAARLKVGVDY